MTARPPQDELGEELARRLREAVAAAGREGDRARAVRELSHLIRARSGLITRCAWCDRLSLGPEWVGIGDLAPVLIDLVDDRLTHGICPECFAGLEARRVPR